MREAQSKSVRIPPAKVEECVRQKLVLFVIVAAATIAAGCSGNGSPIANPASWQVNPAQMSSPSPIQHVVLIVQENRTFNNFFATFPGADGTTTGKVEANANCSPPIAAGTIALVKAPLLLRKDLRHAYPAFTAARDKGKLDGFDLADFGNGQPECAYPYMYTDPNDIKPYWDMAQQYTLAEHMFTEQGSDSFTAHQALIAGSTIVKQNKSGGYLSMVDLPGCSGPNCYWGCDAPPPTRTHLINEKGVELAGQPGPFPCTNKFTVNYPSIDTLLDPKSVTWKYYVPPSNQNFGKLLNAFDVIYDVRHGSDWNNIVTPQTKIFNDISNNALPNVSWVIPDEPDSDHPGLGKDTGPSWVASVVNAIGESPYWNSTAIVIIWDDWGGLYDNRVGKKVGYGGLGLRVPAIVVSPYARPGYISKTNYEFAGILKYIENNWNLGTLGGDDKRATSIIDCFNYSQNPIPFVPIASSHDKSYFIHRRPSFERIDDDM
jgi:phospholipase C